VLTEETMIFVGALAALGFVVLGTLELLWPSRRTRAARHDAPPIRRWRSNHPRHATGAPDRYLRRPNAAKSAPPPAPPPPPASDEIARRPAETEERALVERCFELHQAHRYTDVVELATRGLADHPSAALASVLALAHEALHDHAAARAALESAIDGAPAAERATYQRQLATLALRAAQSLVTSAAAPAAPDAESRVNDLRNALAWLEQGQAAAPEDTALRELAATAQTRLWPAYEQVVMALVQRQDFPSARRLLREALDDARVPPVRAATFRQLLSGTFAGEIGQLTAQAIRSMQEARESEALGALEHAERLLATIDEQALSPQRREEVDRRLWWGYNKLGVRRVAAGAFEDAIDPLLRAFRLAAGAPDRQAETRTALVHAFEGWTEACALAVREVADQGDGEAAIVRTDALSMRLHAALGEGLSEYELSGAFARVRCLLEELRRRV
jgi:tetratricopeptide (TPR) repeat protein